MLLEGLLQCACLPATTDELPVRTSARPCCHARSRSVSAMVVPGYIHCLKYVAHPHPEHWFKLLLCYADSGAPEKPLCLTLSYVCAHTLPAHCRRLESLWPLRRWQLGHLLGRRWTVLRPTSANPALLLEPGCRRANRARHCGIACRGSRLLCQAERPLFVDHRVRVYSIP